jgi:predicted tellurium resistance membrane protein TerC
MDHFLTADGLIAFGTLFALELVLGIDNIIFISIIAGRLPKEDQNRARMVGLALAVFTRILLLLIPRLGMQGAALASLIAYMVPFLSLFMFSKTRTLMLAILKH